MNRSALSAAALQPGGTIPTICACCGEWFQARSVLAAYCGGNCRRRARYYRQQGRPIPAKGSKWTQPIRPQVVQPEILPAQPAESALAPFAYGNHQVRVITDEQGMPWFVAADLLGLLGLDRKAMERLESDERGVSSIHTPGGHQSMTTVNESGLYSLILGSRKPEARTFKRWVTHEVLPAIRRTGGYSVPTARPQPPQLPEGVHVVAATRRRAAELWHEALQRSSQLALSRQFSPAHRTDAGLPLAAGYTWQQLSLAVRP